MARSTGKTKTAPPSRRKRDGAPAKMPRIAQVAERLGSMIPQSELQQLPKDLSSQIDHYVYGTPKR